MARAATTSDVFNAIAEADRRDILDALITGEMAVGAIVDNLSMSQPQPSKHLRLLSEGGARHVPAARASPAVPPGPLAPPAPARVVGQMWEAWNDRMDRMDDPLNELQEQGGAQ